MSVIIRLQGLSWSASAMDIRNFFQGLSIPPGGVRIIGGEKGDAFIAFTTDEDARQAMMMSNNTLNGNPVQLFLSSKTEMQNTIVEAKNSASTPVSAQGVTPAQPVNASPSIDSTPNLNFSISQSPQSFPPTNQLPNNSLIRDPAALQPALASLSQLHGLLPPTITQALGYLASANLGNRTAPNQTAANESDSRNFGQFPQSDNFNNSNISGNFPPSSESAKDPGYYMPPSTKPLDGFPGQNNQTWGQQSSDRSTSNVYSSQNRGNERNNFPPFGNQPQSMPPPPFGQNSPHLFDTKFPQGGYRAPFPGSADHRFPVPGQSGHRFPGHINQPFPEQEHVEHGHGRVDQRFADPLRKEQFPHLLGRTDQPAQEIDSSCNQTSSNVYLAAKLNVPNVDVKKSQNSATSVQKTNIITNTDKLANEVDEFGRSKRPSASTTDDRSRERDRSRRDSPRDREKRDRSRDRDSRRRDRDDDRKPRRDRDRDRDRDRRTRDSDRDRRERSRDTDRKISPSSELARKSKKRSLSPVSKDDKPDNRKRQSDQTAEIKTETEIPTSATTIPSVPPIQPLFPVIPQLNIRKGLLGAPPPNLTPLIPNVDSVPAFVPGISPNINTDATLPTSDGRPPPLMGLPLSRNTPNMTNRSQSSTRPRRSRFDNQDENQTGEDSLQFNPNYVSERPPFMRNEVGHNTDNTQRSIVAGPGPKPLEQLIPQRPDQQDWNKTDSIGANRGDDLGKGLQTFPKEQERRPALLATPDSSTLKPNFIGDNWPHDEFRGPPPMMPPFENKEPNFNGPPDSESELRKPCPEPEGDFDGRSNNSRPPFENRAGRPPFKSDTGPLLRENLIEGRPPVGGRPVHDRPINPNFEEGNGKQFDRPSRFGPHTDDFDARKGPPGRDFQPSPVEHQGRGDFNRPPFLNQREGRDNMLFREGGRPPFDQNTGGSGSNFRDDSRSPHEQNNRGGPNFREDSRPPFQQNDRRVVPNDRQPFNQNIRGGPNFRDGRPPFDQNNRGAGPDFRDNRPSFDQGNRGGPNLREDGRPHFDQNDRRGRPNFRDDGRPPFEQNNRGGPNFRDDGRPPFDQNNRGGPNFRDDGRPPFDQNNRGGPNFRDDVRPQFDQKNRGGTNFRDGRPPVEGPNLRADGVPPMGEPNLIEDGRPPMGGSNFREDGKPPFNQNNRCGPNFRQDLRPPFDQDSRSGPSFRQDGRPPFDQDNRVGPNFRQDGRPQFDKDSRGGPNFRQDGRPPFDQDDRRGGPNFREDRPPFDQNNRGGSNIRDRRGEGPGFRDGDRPPFEHNDRRRGPNFRDDRSTLDQHNSREEGRPPLGHQSERRDGPVRREDGRSVENRHDRRDGPKYRDDRRPFGATKDDRTRADDRNDYRDRRKREHSEDKHEEKTKTEDKHETKSEESDHDQPLCTILVDEMVKETTYRDIRKFFSECLIPKDGIKLLNDENGRPIGKAYIKFAHQEAYQRACQMNRMRLNSVAVLIKPASKKEYDDAIDSYYPDVDSRGSNDIEMSQSITATLRALKGDSDQNVGKDMVVKICQLPKTTKADGVKRFFSGCDIAKNGEAVFIESDRKSECTGTCFVEFANEKSYKSALSQKRQYENCAINIEQGSKKDIENLVNKMKSELGKSFSGAGQGEKAVKSTETPKAKESEQKNEVSDDKTTMKDSKNLTCTCLRIRNIPYNTRNYDIRCIFEGLDIHINNVQIPHDAVGNPCGEAFMDVGNSKDVEKAMVKDNFFYRDKVLKMTPLCRTDMISMLRNFRQSLQVEKSSKQDVFYYVKATNLPVSVSTGELMTFFSGYNPAPESIRLNIVEPNQTSECSSALVGFRMREDAERAVSNVNKKPLRNRPIPLTKVML